MVLLLVVIVASIILLAAWLVDRSDRGRGSGARRSPRDIDFEARNSRVDVASAHFFFTDAFRRRRP